MGANDSEETRSVARIERVRCLGCSASYVKPVGGGTVSANPGCPECGYVGWVLEQVTVRRDDEPSRSVSGRLRRRTG
jgi:transposase-like protein